jgi:hypothetical protein
VIVEHSFDEVGYNRPAVFGIRIGITAIRCVEAEGYRMRVDGLKRFPFDPIDVYPAFAKRVQIASL